MTLCEMIRRYPDAFHRQEWYCGELFMDASPRTWIGWPTRIVDTPPTGRPVDELGPAFTAADLAALWLEDQTRDLWNRYLWTADVDHLGQRVYVGVNDGLFEIHRHLHLTERWGVPC